MKGFILKYLLPIAVLTALFSLAVLTGAFSSFSYQIIALIFIIFGFGAGVLLATNFEDTTFLNLCAVLVITGFLMLAINM